MQEGTQTQPIDELEEINQAIDVFFLRSITEAAAISPHYESLWQEMYRLISAGGKRLRPKMVLLAYQLFGGTATEAVLPIAVATELLHMSMLIHDDIIDRDYVRYGVDNIAGAYTQKYAQLVADDSDRLHYSHSAALLAGDLLISGAYQQILTAALPAEKVVAVQKLFGQSIFEVAGGELIDTETTFRPLGEIKAETIAIYKTASYTFVSPLMIGAQLAEAPEKERACLRTFATNIGIAFQLRDDILGVFGDQSKTGKSVLGDLREGKRTYMIEQFYLLASRPDVAQFETYFGSKSLSEKDATVLRKLLTSTGAYQKTIDAISLYEQSAITALNQMHLDGKSQAKMMNLVEIATGRNK